MELEQAVGVMRTVGVPATGEVVLRFRRAVAPGPDGASHNKLNRLPSIYGIDFIGAYGREVRVWGLWSSWRGGG